MRLGMRLGSLLESGDVVCLSGDMGAGKTVLAAGIGKGWGATQALTSPTFSLVHVHRRTKDHIKLYHLDCYRLSSVLEVESLGLDDILNDPAVAVFEWPEQIESVLPEERLWIEFQVLEPTRRNIRLQAAGNRYEELLARLRKQITGRS
jgi:tRNA threonylcarbamoyladenosine biosynthesis protein TsaE